VVAAHVEDPDDSSNVSAAHVEDPDDSSNVSVRHKLAAPQSGGDNRDQALLTGEAAGHCDIRLY
jgi:hypothetical protein